MTCSVQTFSRCRFVPMLSVMAPQIPTNTGRRLGERIHLDDVFIAWRVDEVLPGRLRDKPRPVEVGRLIDVSVSGASIVAPGAPELRPGRAVVIRLDDAEAVVRIRRISDFGDEDFRLFGVEFIDSDLVFRDWINGLLSARRPDEHGLGWDRAD
jgi:hypothetical protein